MSKLSLFQKIQNYWTVKGVYNKVTMIVCILFCIGIKIGRILDVYCILDENLTATQKAISEIFFILLISPFSIILEWAVFQVYAYHNRMFKHMLLTKVLCCQLSDQYILTSYLQQASLSPIQLRRWQGTVGHYTSIICDLLEQQFQSKFTAVDTGSVVERLGLPLGWARKTMWDILRTDHDVMFIPEDVKVSLDKENQRLHLRYNEKLVEYVNLISTHGQEWYLNGLTTSIGRERRLDNRKTVKELNSIVSSIPTKAFCNESDKHDEMISLLGLTCLPFTKNFARWNSIFTELRGPAVNFSINTMHLNLMIQHEKIR